MARNNDPGKDFDAQWEQSRRRGQEKAARGESHWAEDKYLKRNSERLSSGPARHAGSKDTCLAALMFLGGLAWVLGEAVSRVT